MNYFLIANPHSRNGRARRKIHEVCRAMERRGLKYEMELCQSMDHARELSRKAKGFDVVVAVGGDGTINRVLNGFFDTEGRRISQARMGIIHTGTSPDFCLSHGIPTQIEPAVDVLAAGHCRRVSIGKITHANQTGYFGCCANIGLGASLAREANQGIRRRVGDFLGTFISLLRVLAKFRAFPVQLSLDGQERFVPDALNISIGKTHRIASGIRVKNDLSPMDTRFYVLTARRLGARDVLPTLRALYSGRPIRPGGRLSLEYARRVEITSSKIEIEYDGDPAEACPCRIETARDALELITSI
jgi:YegS/Rv2252/BmrU family lipid kinase